MQGDESAEEKKSMPFADDGTLPSLAQIDERVLEDSGLLRAGSDDHHTPDRAERALVGQIVDDKFRITDILGKGGMSVVYKALWVVLNKTVALKTMHSHLVTDTNALMRFKQEAQATIQLEHPNVIKVYDFGITGGEDSKPYMVMDFIEGESLSERLKRKGTVKVREALQIFTQVASALEHAHKKGVIHRDLKPSNIMLLHKEGEECNIKIVDFGIAKLLPQEGEQAHRLTQTGDIFGSPMYMSPEQCMGRAVDKRSDVYAIGCVMYETLSGVPPHMGNNVFETFHKHISEIPATLAIPGAETALLERLEAIVFRALAKEPDKRYQSMAEMESELKSLENDLQQGMKGTNLRLGIERQQRTVLRFMHAAPKLALLSFFAILVVGISASYGWSKCSWFFQPHEFKASPTHWLDFMPPRRKRVALSAEERQKLIDQAQIANHFSLVNNAMYSTHVARQMAQEADMCAQIGDSAHEISSRAKALEIMSYLKDDEGLDYARLAEMHAESLIAQGNLDLGQGYLEKAEFIRERLKMSNNPRVYLLLGYLYLQTLEKASTKEEKDKMFRRTLTQLEVGQAMLLEQQNSADSRVSAVFYSLIGDCYYAYGDYKNADKNYELAETTIDAARIESGTANKNLMKELALTRAQLALQQREFKKASDLFRKAMPYAKARFKHETDLLQRFFDSYAYAAWNSGYVLYAVELHDKAVSMAHTNK